jgi:hypothetical protein
MKIERSPKSGGRRLRKRHGGKSKTKYSGSKFSLLLLLLEHSIITKRYVSTTTFTITVRGIE